MKTPDDLWNDACVAMREFDKDMSHNSDLFSVLARIMAYYQARGTPPEQMISDTLKERINLYMNGA